MRDKTILLVEDNKDDEDLTLLALRKGHIKNKVVVARDGAEALELLFGKSELVADLQLILLDLKLPKINGVEVLKRIRADERLRSLPVTVLTSSREDRDVSEAYQHGANSYICKPVEMNQFMEAVKQVGLYWLILNESGNL